MKKYYFTFILILLTSISYGTLLHQYNINEGSGNYLWDSTSMSGDTITITNCSWGTDSTLGTVLFSTRASGSYGLTTLTNGWGLSGATAVTIIINVNFTATMNYMGIPFDADTQSDQIQLALRGDASNKSYVNWNTVTYSYRSPQWLQSWTPNTWYHIACTFSSTVCNVFLNGVYVAGTTATSDAIRSMAKVITVFNYTGGGTSYPLTAKYSVIKVYDEVLSTSTILTDYNDMYNPLTPPTAPATVRDGTGTDISSTTSTTQLSANWDASVDSVSGYKFAIGTTAGGSDTKGWVTLGDVVSTTTYGLSLTLGTTYYFSVKAFNGAGDSSATNSDGQFVYYVSTSVCYILIMNRNDLLAESLWDIGDVVLQVCENDFKGWGTTELDTNVFLTCKVTGDVSCYKNCLVDGTTLQKCREYQVYTASITAEMTSENFCNSLNKKQLE